MDWLKELLRSLPLESISEVLAKVVVAWTHLVEGVPADELPFLAYVGASLLVLALLFFALRLVPKFLRGMLWVLAAAILFTPAGTMGDSGGSAPAIIGVAHALLMGQTELAFLNLLPILAVAIGLLVIGGLVQMIYGIVVDARANLKSSTNTANET